MHSTNYTTIVPRDTHPSYHVAVIPNKYHGTCLLLGLIRVLRMNATVWTALSPYAFLMGPAVREPWPWRIIKISANEMPATALHMAVRLRWQ